jgi:hypothetical protein
MVEAATIVLAVGTVRAGARAAGTWLALGVLVALVAALGPALSLPAQALQLIVGLLLFGMRRLRKAICAGHIPLHDEAAIFRNDRQLRLAAITDRRGGPACRADGVQAVLLEGVEVAFIVLAVSAAAANWWWWRNGALAAAVRHHPRRGGGASPAAARAGEHAQAGGRRRDLSLRHLLDRRGWGWPGRHDLALPALVAGLLLTTMLASASPRGWPPVQGAELMSVIKAVLGEIVHLFGSLALAGCVVRRTGVALFLLPQFVAAFALLHFLGCALILLGNVLWPRGAEMATVICPPPAPLRALRVTATGPRHAWQAILRKVEQWIAADQ